MVSGQFHTVQFNRRSGLPAGDFAWTLELEQGERRVIASARHPKASSDLCSFAMYLTNLKPSHARAEDGD